MKRDALIVLVCVCAFSMLATANAATNAPYLANSDTALLFHFDETVGTHSQSPGTFFVQDSSGNGQNLRTVFDTSNPGSNNSNPGVSPFDGVAGPAGLGNAATQGGNQRLFSVFGTFDTSVLNNDTFTIEGWIRNPGPGTFAGLIRVDDDDAGGGSSFRSGIIQFGLDNDLNQLRLAGFNKAGGFFEVKSDATVGFDPDLWYHIAVSYDGDDTGNDSVVKFYFDQEGQAGSGTQLGSTLGGVADFREFNSDGVGGLWVGEWATAQPLNGDLDELRWSNAALDRFNITNAIPEPATATLALVGLGGLVMRRRRNVA